eukprot:TRINITY_DN3474_c0_g1_i4.p1 TRINITY_DN3474_c0_g1~~TRINITY_DN3474_c0_g1_i4.p1  ORF type:complete len:612 (-),score=109.36 TRINITY_DN3474_c0_g1_i4:24-1769(-)
MNTSESALPEEMILYFYPPGVPLATMVGMQGACEGLIAFAGNFTSSPLEVLCLERYKLAFRQVGSLTMVLTSNIDEPDHALTTHLHLIYQAFIFYNRNFRYVLDNVERKVQLLHQHSGSLNMSGSAAAMLQRMELIKDMGRIGRELQPLILAGGARSLMRGFGPLPYIPLPHKGNRTFIQSSQLLHTIKSSPSYLGACILYKSSVVCTHLDLMTTRCILNRLEYLRNNPTFSPHPPSKSGRVEFVPDMMDVYMPRVEVDRLNRERANMGSMSNLAMATPSVGLSGSVDGDPSETYGSVPSSSSFSSFTPLQSLSSSTPSNSFSSSSSAHMPAPQDVNKCWDDEEDPDGIVRLGLYIIMVNDLSLAIIMSYQALSDKDNIKRLRLSTDSKLYSLQQDLENVLASTTMGGLPTTATTSQTQQAAAAGGGAANAPPGFKGYGYQLLVYDDMTQQSSGTLVSTLNINSSVGLGGPSNGGQAAGGSAGSGGSSGSASGGSFGVPAQEVDFLGTSAHVHACFQQDPAVSQLILRDSSGEVYCKRVFGREVFYQPKPANATVAHDKFLEAVEKTVRNTLRDDHNIAML